ncbi:MAG: hypothetical protein SFV54_16510 [Bryobacteraceae bacterium]|nr:hypothetical protein [Bryobacteraceae bacterium]
MHQDTSPDARRFYYRRLAELAPAERAAIAVELCQASDALLREGIRRRHPYAGPEEVNYWLLRSRYGRELADRVHGR